jgi:hypothetical protein
MGESFLSATETKQVLFSTDQDAVIYGYRRCNYPLTHIVFTQIFESGGNIRN